MTELGSEIWEVIKDTGALINMAYKLWFIAIICFTAFTIIIYFWRKKIYPDAKIILNKVNFYELIFGIVLIIIGLIIYIPTEKAIANSGANLAAKRFVIILRLLQLFGAAISVIGASFVHVRYVAETNILREKRDQKRALRKKKRPRIDPEEESNKNGEHTK